MENRKRKEKNERWRQIFKQQWKEWNERERGELAVEMVGKSIKRVFTTCLSS